MRLTPGEAAYRYPGCVGAGIFWGWLLRVGWPTGWGPLGRWLSGGLQTQRKLVAKGFAGLEAFWLRGLLAERLFALTFLCLPKCQGEGPVAGKPCAGAWEHQGGKA